MSNSIVTKTILFKDHPYPIQYPTVGQFIDIRVLEQQLSRGNLKELVGGLGLDVDAYIYITTYSHISILLPDLIKDLKVDSPLELSMLDYQDLVEVFTEQIQPWFEEWQKQIKERMKKKSEPSTK